MKLEIARGLFLAGALSVASLAAAAWHEPGTQVISPDTATLTQLGYAAGIALLAPLGDRFERRRIILVKSLLLGAALLAIAPHGWVCGTGREWLRVGDRDCAIGGVQPLDARGWALALREDARTNPTPTLATVVVDGKSQPKRRFAASPEYCVDPRRVRGWNTRGGDIVVITQPRRGSRERASYRLELTGACPEAGYASQLSLVSGVGIGFAPFDP